MNDTLKQFLDAVGVEPRESVTYFSYTALEFAPSDTSSGKRAMTVLVYNDDSIHICPEGEPRFVVASERNHVNTAAWIVRTKLGLYGIVVAGPKSGRAGSVASAASSSDAAYRAQCCPPETTITIKGGVTLTLEQAKEALDEAAMAIRSFGSGEVQYRTQRTIAWMKRYYPSMG